MAAELALINHRHERVGLRVIEVCDVVEIFDTGGVHLVQNMQVVPVKTGEKYIKTVDKLERRFLSVGNV